MTSESLAREPASFRRRFGAAAIALLALGLSLAPGRPAAAAATDIGKVAEIPSRMTPDSGFLAVDPSRRRMFEIGEPTAGPGMTIIVYDLDTYRKTAEIRIEDAFSGLGGHLSALDAAAGILYVLYPLKTADGSIYYDLVGSDTGGFLVQTTKTPLAIAAIDTRSLTVKARKALPDIGLGFEGDQTFGGGNGSAIKAMAIFDQPAYRGKLFLASQSTATGTITGSLSNHLVSLHRFDLAQILDPGAVLTKDWSFPIPACPMPMARRVGAVMVASSTRNAIHLPCRQGTTFGAATQPVETPGIVRVSMARPNDVATFTTEFFPISGSLEYGLAAADHKAGRLFVQVTTGAGETGVWVFDVRYAAWLGRVVLSDSAFTLGKMSGVAVDESTGRLYVFSARDGAERTVVKVLVGSTRALQIGQGRIVEIPTSLEPDTWAVPVDPVRHRLFLKGQSKYLVLESTVPAPPSDASDDPDDNTIDVAEGALTGANFSGGARAVGARIKWVGGSKGVLQNTGYDDYETFPFNELLPSPYTRDLHLARVNYVGLSNSEATAAAIAADRDQSTQADLEAYGREWPYAPQQCVDFGKAKTDAAGTGTRVRCVRAAFDAAAAAQTEGGTFASLFAETERPEIPVTIGATSASSHSYRDAKRGVVSVAESEVRGVEIAGVAGIGRVYSKATSWASGRPLKSNGQGARGEYVREIEDVWVMNGGTRTIVCGNVCDPVTVRNALNTALGARMRVDLPVPDPQYFLGTKKGYQALVIRSPGEQVNDRNVNEETEVRLEVPAMVLTLFNDGRVSSRVVITLAATSAESHYGIYRLDKDVDAPRDPISFGPGVIVKPDIPVIGPQTPPPADNPVQRIVRKTVTGLKFAFSTPGRSARAMALWVLLIAPLVMSVRRRALDKVGARLR